MEITYTLQPGDLTRLQNLVMKRAGSGSKVFFGVCALLGCLGLLVSLFTDHSRHRAPPNWTAMLVSIVTPLALVAIFWLVLRHFAAKNQTANPLFTQTQTLRISAQNFCQQAQDAQTIVQWTGVYDIIDDEQLLCFFVSKDTAHVVPKRAFASPEEADAFYRTAVAYWKGEPAPVEPTETWPPPPARIRPEG